MDPALFFVFCGFFVPSRCLLFSSGIVSDSRESLAPSPGKLPVSQCQTPSWSLRFVNSLY